MDIVKIAYRKLKPYICDSSLTLWGWLALTARWIGL